MAIAEVHGVELGLPRWSLREPSFSRHGSAGFCEGLPNKENSEVSWGFPAAEWSGVFVHQSLHSLQLSQFIPWADLSPANLSRRASLKLQRRKEHRHVFRKAVFDRVLTVLSVIY